MTVVFAIGSNGSGQLGIGHKEDVSVPKQVLFHPEDASMSIAGIATGGNHTILLTKSGDLYWSGDPSSGACGLGKELQVPVFQPARLSQSERDTDIGPVSLICATWEASFIVASDATGKKARIFSLGVGAKGELGSGEFIVRTPTATPLPDFPPPGTEIVDLAACMGHVVAVLDNGDAYGWGNGRKGQVGEPAGTVHAPRKVDGVDFQVYRAVCTKEATCLFGSPESGRVHVLGSDKWRIKSNASERLSPWTDVAAGWGAVYILRNDGSLQAWGRDDHGQLPPPGLPALTQIAIGSEHAVALTDKGDVLAWGWGEHGNCGPQVENNDVKGRWNVIASSNFIPKNSKIVGIGAGCATSWVYIDGK